MQLTRQPMHITGRAADRRVTVDGHDLSPEPSQRLYNHSPDGFAWGYEGSGPAQLALAILLSAGVPASGALACHQDFKRTVVATWADAFSDFSVEVDVGAWVRDWTLARPR